ncbi:MULTISPECIES: peptidoglycan-binding domain-containing protein [Streptomyces]|uniref:Peptidoglycan-binding protein n=1 Tax=Streptomyces liliifuscus TaxID=2797636 RepID=A0A7T7KXC0_9ACTN|nr:peptidoglycan-binding domain-containing protein [Streptomyces liliifuscus]QQM41284.1 peptidoglycan-binding protein [Streptomyces liliifuscus]
MKTLHTLRAKAGISAAAVLLSGVGLSLATASPAAAYAGYCNKSVTRSSALGSVSFVFDAKIPAYNGTMDCYMNQGADSAAVEALQTTLNECYGRSLTVDGIFGPATKTALEYAQGKADIGVDGKYGTETRRGLKWYWDQRYGSRWGCARLGDVIHIGV